MEMRRFFKLPEVKKPSSPFFKLPVIKRPSNPLSPQGLRALAIVLVAIFFISAAAYIGLNKAKQGPTVLPAATSQEELTPELEPTEEPTPSSPSPTEAATPSARRIEVDILVSGFQPADIIAGKGSTVVWANQDTEVHTVTAEDGRFDSGPILPGKSFEQRFEKIRSYSYFCTFHPEMKGTVTIQ